MRAVRARTGGDEVMADAQPQLLATPTAGEQESLVRENVPDPLAGEQTWPTEQVCFCAPQWFFWEKPV